MLLLAAWALLGMLEESDVRRRRLLALLLPAIVLPYIGNTAGWIFTEIGRQPWIVFGLMKTEAGVSNAVTAGEVLFSLVTFTLLYGALMGADLYLLAKYAKAGLQKPEPEEPASGVERAWA